MAILVAADLEGSNFDSVPGRGLYAANGKYWTIQLPLPVDYSEVA